MTTNIIEQSKGIPPSQYTAHVERVTNREAAWRARRRAERIRRRLLLGFVVLVLAVIAGVVL